jgi:hypothetical protein
MWARSMSSMVSSFNRLALHATPRAVREHPRFALVAAAVGCVVLVYFPSLWNGFAWLDELEIVQRGLIIEDQEGVRSLFAGGRCLTRGASSCYTHR